MALLKLRNSCLDRAIVATIYRAETVIDEQKRLDLIALNSWSVVTLTYTTDNVVPLVWLLEPFKSLVEDGLCILKVSVTENRELAFVVVVSTVLNVTRVTDRRAIVRIRIGRVQGVSCLLYTSDAADEVRRV